MELTENLWNKSLKEIKQGYIEDKDSFVCLLCEKEIEKGIIYPHEDLLYEAEKYIQLHIKKTHGSVFDYLTSLNKKLNGLTEHQRSLLRLFYQGKSDAEIQKELGIGSTSTIRHHRFTLKEKERQAKAFLAIMELLKEKGLYSPAFLPNQKTATMVDDK